jgi:hypothetical protein
MIVIKEKSAGLPWEFGKCSLRALFLWILFQFESAVLFPASFNREVLAALATRLA